MRLKVKDAIIIIVLAVYVAFILWLTLFSRLGSEERHFYPLFWSYKAIANGNKRMLFEVVGNIILFIPIGLVATLILHLNLGQSIAVGLTLSLIIETCQWSFWIGSFEIDDIIHNTIGVIAGTILIKNTSIGQKLRMIAQNEKRNIVFFICLVLLINFMPLICNNIKTQTMIKYATMNDRENGTKNLLVLSPEVKNIGKTEFKVLYNDDGSLLIRGYSENRAWIEIGRLTLPKGSYSFSGLSGVTEKTVGLEIEYYNKEQNSYIRLTKDVGPIDKVIFELEESTKLRVLIGLYDGAKGEYLARPAIYREK